MTKSQLIEKVYRCIDEVYPGTDSESPDVEEFNIPAFLDEAIRWVVKAVPVTALGKGTPHYSLTLPTDFLRLLELKMAGWKVPVMEALTQDNPRYWQQQNPVLCAGVSRPIVFLVDGDTRLEPFPLGKDTDGAVLLEPDVLRIFKMEKGVDGLYTDSAYAAYPDKLLDITAWKTAELIFSVMQDANGVSIAQAQITSILPTL